MRRSASSVWRAMCRALVPMLVWSGLSASADLLPFPWSAGQRGDVTCLEKPEQHYDIYLPMAYSTNGPALPIVYTFDAHGGGMVTTMEFACWDLNIICVGVTGSSNGAPWEVVLRECATVARDIRQRVLFDPTAEFASGYSGGGEVAFMFSRFRAQHVAGVFSQSGWLGRGGGYPWYQTTDRVLTNLLVTRSEGNSDTGRFWVLAPDSNYLASCSAVIYDQYFNGAHTHAPPLVQVNALNWMLGQRIPAGPTDQADAQAQAADWRARIAGGARGAVLRECVATLMNRPRSWFAYQAQLVLDDLMLDYDSFRPLGVDGLAQGDFASDLFYYIARGAGDAGDWARYYSGLKTLTGITGVNGDRAGDIGMLLTNYSYPGPILQCTANTGTGQANLSFTKDTPGLDCFAQVRTNSINDSWQELALPAQETSTSWSVILDMPSDCALGFYRLRTTPSSATSPPWPPQ